MCDIYIYGVISKVKFDLPLQNQQKRLLPDCTSINLTISSAQETPELFAQGIADGWLPEASSCGAASRELLGNIPHEKNCSGYYPEDLWRFGAVLGGQFDVESFINLNWFSVVYLVCLLKGDLCCFYFNPQESYKVKAATYGYFSPREPLPLELAFPVSEVAAEKEKQRLEEEKEKQRQDEEKEKQRQEEEKRRLEEQQRQEEESRRLEEQEKQEEENKRLEEQEKQEEENKRLEEEQEEQEIQRQEEETRRLEEHSHASLEGQQERMQGLGFIQLRGLRSDDSDD